MWVGSLSDPGCTIAPEGERNASRSPGSDRLPAALDLDREWHRVAHGAQTSGAPFPPFVRKVKLCKGASRQLPETVYWRRVTFCA